MQTAFYKFDRDTQFATQRIRAERKARFRVFKGDYNGYVVVDRKTGSGVVFGANRDQLLKEARKMTDRYLNAGMQHQVAAGQGVVRKNRFTE